MRHDRRNGTPNRVSVPIASAFLTSFFFCLL